MLDAFFQTIAEFIYGGLIQIGINGVSIGVINNGVKIFFVFVFLWLYIKRDKKGKTESPPNDYRPKGKFKPPKWTPDGYYYDETKKRWIGPDFKKTRKDK